MNTDTKNLNTVVTLDGSKYVSNAKKVAKSSAEMAKDADKAEEKLNQLKKTAPQTASALSKLGKKTKVDTDTTPATRKLDNLNRKLVHASNKRYSIKAGLSVDTEAIKHAQKETERLNKELDKTSKTRKTSVTGPASGEAGATGGGGGGGATAAAAAGAAGGGGGLLKKAGLAGIIYGGLNAVVSGASKGFNIARQRENNTAAMGFFLGDNKDQTEAMMEWATQASLPTKFSEGEVQSATTRALQVTGGNIDRAKQFVDLAQDMASLNPDKTLFDAMEALADADMGEMARMTEFGFKAGKEEFDAAGGDLFAMRSSNKGKTLTEEYDGGVETMAETTDAKIGTAMGILETTLGDFSSLLLDKAKPAFADVITVVSNVAPKIADGALRFVDVIGQVFNALKPLSPVFELVGSIVGGVVTTALSGLGHFVEDYVVPAIKNTVDFMKPALEGLGRAADKVTGFFDRLKTAMSNFKDTLSHPISAVVQYVDSKGGGGGGKKGGGKKGGRKDATGSLHFPGGFTQMNENGRGEIVDLPSGSRIYPYATTKNIIKKMLSGTKRGGDTNVTVQIDARGSNLTRAQVKQLKDEIVTDIVEAIDNAVPA